MPHDSPSNKKVSAPLGLGVFLIVPLVAGSPVSP